MMTISALPLEDETLLVFLVVGPPVKVFVVGRRPLRAFDPMVEAVQNRSLLFVVQFVKYSSGVQARVIQLRQEGHGSPV